MKRKIILIIGLILTFSLLYSQHKVRISGFVSDKSTGELLIGANIIEKGTQNGTASDNNGYFSIMPEIPSVIQISYIGYLSTEIYLSNVKDTLLRIKLEPGNQLDEVIVKSQLNPKFNVSKLGIKELCMIPSLSGKPDIAKGLQLMPGIMPANEGSSLLLVRGGDIGQNLYLFDNVPVIHVNHLGGFISVFNPEIINNIEVYKGGFPSKYGGRLSSIVNITQRDGDNSMVKGSFCIGLTDAALTLEGPLKLKNSSFIITGRKTLIEGLLTPITKLAGDYALLYGFHDINGKITWKPDDKNSFNLNLYQGDDYLHHWVNMRQTRSHSGVNWGNWLASLRWNRVISSKLFTTTTLSYSRYRLRDKINAEVNDTANPTTYSGNSQARVQDYSIRSAMQYKLFKNWSLDFGIQSSQFIHSPSILYSSDLSVQPEPNTVFSSENAIHFENNFILWNRVGGNIGVRGIGYFTKEFSDFSLEPRANLNFSLNQNHTLNLSYMRTSQFSHLIFTSGNIMDNELWVPSNNKINPSKSDQYTIGWQGNFYNNKYTAEVNAYYKSMTNLATIKEGYSSILGDINWLSKIETGGNGTAKGLEFMIRKTSGVFTGFATYTLSNSTRQFENINYGKEYLYDFDRLHSFSLNLNYHINEKLNLNLTWIYQTGLPYTPITGRYLVQTGEPGEFVQVYEYGERNSAKMVDYHRLDLGLTYKKTTKRRGLPCEWTFSIYNVYNRQNPYNYYYSNSSGEPSSYLRTEPGRTYLWQRSFLPIIPSFSYKVYFDKNSLKKGRVKIKKEKPVFQESYIKDRLDIKIGFGLPNIGYMVVARWWMPHKPQVFSIEGNYGFSKYITGGVFASYSKFEFYNHKINNDNQQPELFRDSAVLITYSAKANIHLMPLIRKQKDSRFDFYVTAKAGGYYFKKTRFEYNAGLGMAIYPGRHFGFYGEYTYGNLIYNSFNWRAGIVIKFNK